MEKVPRYIPEDEMAPDYAPNTPPMLGEYTKDARDNILKMRTWKKIGRLAMSRIAYLLPRTSKKDRTVPNDFDGQEATELVPDSTIVVDSNVPADGVSDEPSSDTSDLEKEFSPEIIKLADELMACNFDIPAMYAVLDEHERKRREDPWERYIDNLGWV
ncbi:hypothetical protein J5X07_03940 [Actinomyces bowdenii]|uniref:hypothetical protein n=1 Tax=Actinomyces bowdenii TaxID=131109 RepID=UPI001ABCC229|nr:hypothetical protein [Actinomyces bowdenii]MBO3724187.1 hypothetical protein [Actinomyces bowdenii]